MKFVLSDERIEYKGIRLHRVRAVKEMFSILDGATKPGELGGWIESEKNLSQNGLCWIHSEAKVYGNAHVCEDARITDEAIACGDAIISGEALVAGCARISGNALVTDLAKIDGRQVSVGENAWIGEYA